MATRGAIVRTLTASNDQFSGVYHHWDSNPESLGQTLVELYLNYFDKDYDRMMKYLIDQHPAGWSTINDRDFFQSPGFGGNGPECYCHGERSESPNEITHKNASDCGCEYVYGFFKCPVTDHTKMVILSSYHKDGSKMIGAFGRGDPDAAWRLIGVIDLDILKGDPIINWETVLER